MSEEDRKERKWRTYRRHEDCPYPELYRRLGLRPADTKFNKRAAAYAKSASWYHYYTARRRRLGLGSEAAEEG